jgi:uncharacterized paraquat-inducible protein A
MSAWKKFKEAMAAEAKPWDMLYPTRYADDATAKKRYDICLECPELTKHTKQCKKCSCFMMLKTKLELAQCPIGKW